VLVFAENKTASLQEFNGWDKNKRLLLNNFTNQWEMDCKVLLIGSLLEDAFELLYGLVPNRKELE